MNIYRVDKVHNSSLTPLWTLTSQGLIFVVDSNDRERVAESAEELSKMVSVAYMSIYKILFLVKEQYAFCVGILPYYCKKEPKTELMVDMGK